MGCSSYSLDRNKLDWALDRELPDDGKFNLGGGVELDMLKWGVGC